MAGARCSEANSGGASVSNGFGRTSNQPSGTLQVISEISSKPHVLNGLEAEAGMTYWFARVNLSRPRREKRRCCNADMRVRQVAVGFFRWPGLRG